MIGGCTVIFSCDEDAEQVMQAIRRFAGVLRVVPLTDGDDDVFDARVKAELRVRLLDLARKVGTDQGS